MMPTFAILTNMGQRKQRGCWHLRGDLADFVSHGFGRALGRFMLPDQYLSLLEPRLSAREYSSQTVRRPESSLSW